MHDLERETSDLLQQLQTRKRLLHILADDQCAVVLENKATTGGVLGDGLCTLVSL